MELLQDFRKKIKPRRLSNVSARINIGSSVITELLMRFPFKLPAEKEFDAVGFGTNAVDYLILVPEYPAFDSKVRLRDYFQAAGGEVATTMVGLRRLGLKTAYAGRFGDDREGEFGWQSLIEENVETRFCERVSEAKTQVGFIVIDERSGERTVIWDRDEKLAYDVREAPLEAARLGKILHLTPHDAEACISMAGAAKEAGAVVSLDADNVFPGIERLLPLVDVLIASADFPRKMTGIADVEPALGELSARYGCAVVGTTLGEKGSLLLCENKFVNTAGFVVPGGCRDTTGAGDAFRVGLLYGILMGETVEAAARTANAVAALKCRRFGARAALPVRAELESFISD